MPVFHLPAFLFGEVDAGIRGTAPMWAVIAAVVLAGIWLLTTARETGPTRSFGGQPTSRIDGHPNASRR
jgi:hypothetical protein